MKSESWPKPKSLEDQSVKKINKEDEKKEYSRRDALSLGLRAAGLVGAAYLTTDKKSPLNSLINYLSGESIDEADKKPTPEQELIEEEDARSIGEIVSFDRQVELNLEEMEKIKRNWKKRYNEEPKLRNSLIKGYREMGGWEKYLREIFKQEGVPEDFIYLALPESHWDPKAVSKAGAVGPYQFMESTAKKLDLETGRFDERKDPLKSGRACARLLKDLYDRCGDWNLALSGYNGGFFWKYKNRAKKNKENFSYEGFLKYIEEQIRLIKKEILEAYDVYVVKKGDNLTKIAGHFGVDIDSLMKINGIEDANKIRLGMKIKVPKKQSNQRREFQQKIKGFSENLNYPAKYNAIMELIREGFVTKQVDTVRFETIKIKQKKTGIHIFRKSDKTLASLARQKGVSINEILRINPKLNPRNLKGGERINLPPVGGEITLEEIAKEQKVPIERLVYLNPSIDRVDVVLPDEYRLRI